ncbi:MAG: hypothetical protein KIT57_16830 [Blastocatellales bacterium]|nr:hypothetical protein [Blastocatellales bacterium]
MKTGRGAIPYGRSERIHRDGADHASSNLAAQRWGRRRRLDAHDADQLGRVTEAAIPRNGFLSLDTGTNSNWTGSVTSGYNANQTTVTDQAGKAAAQRDF